MSRVYDFHRTTLPAPWPNPRKDAPGINRYGWTSENWSGYVVARKGQAIQRVSGRWVVPRVQSTTASAYSSAWLGIDGFDNGSLIQVGTEQDSLHGTPVYYAWWEVLPRPERRILNVPIRPGDTIYAEVRHLIGDDWVITIRNVTEGKQFITVQRYVGPRTTAEWILEAPEVNGKVTKLARYQSFTFERCLLNSHPVYFTPRQSGAMVQNERIVSAPVLSQTVRDRFRMRYVP